MYHGYHNILNGGGIMIQNNENPMATAETSEHSYHLEDGASCYNQLDQQWQTILNQYIEKGRGKFQSNIVNL